MERAMSASVAIELRDGVGWIVLDRPQVGNAVSLALARELGEALGDLGGRSKVIAIRGAGGNFCTGGDFEEVSRLRREGRDSLRRLFDAFGAALSSIATLDVPVVAVVEGHAVAGGFELMQACDLSLVRTDARIGDNHTNFGMVPGGGSSQRLPRLVGRQRALGLILSGERLSGSEAAAWGLVYRAFSPADFEHAVEGFLAGLSAKEATAVARIKALVRSGSELDLDTGLELERQVVLTHLEEEAGAAGVRRFRENRREESKR
jgi:enoyl-CoA hydratase/carnithine racemase